MTRQELKCSACGVTVRFDMNFDRDGNHEIICPKCKHVHYRIVEDGKITDIRYRSSMQTIYVTNVNWTTSSAGSSTTFTGQTGYGTGQWFINNSWLNSTSASTQW